MYHPQKVAAARAKLEQHFKLELVESTPAQVEEFTARLQDAVDDRGRPARALSKEESWWVRNETLQCKASYRYAAERYHRINVKGRGLLLLRFNEAQELILQKIAEMELTAEERGDGILYDLLKARQIGGSTLSQSLAAHRTTTQGHVFALAASDVPENSAYLFDMYERIVEHLPWWLRPEVLNHVKDSEMLFDTGSHAWIGSGKSTRGTEGKRGQLGRGKSLSVVHLSELSTWDNPGQIEDALMPTIHPDPRVLVAFESTAKGRGNYWHKHWLLACRGIGRHFPIFVPWYGEPGLYSRRAPVDWSPSKVTLEHAARCERDAPKWLGRPARLTREQLYWYETKREELEAKEMLAQFLEEYAADPAEAFQFSGRGIFGPLVLERIGRQQRALAGVYDIGSAAEMQHR